VIEDIVSSLIPIPFTSASHLSGSFFSNFSNSTILLIFSRKKMSQLVILAIFPMS
jgi:hypothetical protein